VSLVAGLGPLRSTTQRSQRQSMRGASVWRLGSPESSPQTLPPVSKASSSLIPITTTAIIRQAPSSGGGPRAISPCPRPSGAGCGPRPRRCVYRGDGSSPVSLETLLSRVQARAGPSRLPIYPACLRARLTGCARPALRPPRVTQDPLIPIGCAATFGCLTAGLYAFKSGQVRPRVC